MGPGVGRSSQGGAQSHHPWKVFIPSKWDPRTPISGTLEYGVARGPTCFEVFGEIIPMRFFLRILIRPLSKKHNSFVQRVRVSPSKTEKKTKNNNHYGTGIYLPMKTNKSNNVGNYFIQGFYGHPEQNPTGSRLLIWR